MKEKEIEEILSDKHLNPAWVKKVAKEIDSLYPTLNRDKVEKEDFHRRIRRTIHYTTNKDTGVVIHGMDHAAQDIYDFVCSLSLPTMSEEDKKKLADNYSRNLVGNDNVGSTAYLNHYAVFLAALDAALKEITKPKEE
jgi:hypothetical protein